jgi:ATP-dependent Clp protease ATP-binding subunit ClpC
MIFQKKTESNLDKKMVFFREPLLETSYASRIIVRVFINVWLIVQVAATVTFIMSDIDSLFWIGVLSGLYLFNRLIHFGHADHIFTDGRVKDENVALYVTPRAKKAIVLAYDKASILGGSFSLHLTKVLTETSSIQEVLNRLEIKRDEFATKLDEYLKKQRGIKKSRDLLIKEVENLVLSAFYKRKKYQRFINQTDLFVALGISDDDNTKALFSVFEIDPNDLDQVVVFGLFKRDPRIVVKNPMALIGFLSKSHRGKHRIMNRAWTARPTPLLDQLSVDLTDLARSGRVGFLVGHEDEYDRLVDVLSRPTKPNILMIGESGIGKQAIVEYLAHMMVKDKVPKELFDRRVVLLDVGRLIAGVDQGMLQARVQQILYEIASAGNIILFVPDIHNLFKTGEQDQINVASIVLPAIASENFFTIGTTTPRDFKQYIERENIFKETFEIVRINEVTAEESRFILSYRSIFLEKKYKLRITFGAIKTAVRLAKKYFHEVPLPTSAEDLLREATSYVYNKDRKILTSEDVIVVAEKRTNVPIHQADSGEADTLIHLEELIHRRLINQNEAVTSVSNALREYRSGLVRSGKPIGVFLFIGPTGVGKTELAKTVAQIQLGSESAMSRFDMSEYQNTESIHRLIGSPDGKVSGMLTDRILEKPYTLLLLDEFEKAHKDILKLFLQVFDEGNLTDNWGRKISFENTIIIATSNAEANFIKESIDAGKAVDDIREELQSRLTKYFSPELLNRFSTVVIFKNLTIDNLKIIVRLRLEELSQLVKEKHNIELIFKEDTVNTIANLGYDPSFGARPLQRVISDRLRGPLAELILSKKVKRGMKIEMDIDGKNLHICDSNIQG